MELPSQKTRLPLDVERLTMLLYGDYKIGKTTLAATIEKALFLFTESGQGDLSTYNVTISSWQDFLDTCILLKEDAGKRFTTVVIDTVDILFKFCQEHVCEKAGVTHPSDKDVGWGKGWDLLYTEFGLTLAKLMQLGYGVIFISHMKEKEITTKQSTTTVIKPTLKEGAMQIVSALVDFIAYCYVETEFSDAGEKSVRHMLIGPNDKMQTGSRYAHLLPERIPMDFGYLQKLLKNNLQ